jgi:hypothetical protein
MALVATNGAQFTIVRKGAVAPVMVISSLAVTTDDPFG